MSRTLLLAPAAAAALALSSAALAQDAAPVAPEAAQGVVFEPGTPAFADVLAKAKAEGKPAFIDFSTEWCGWCRRLEKDTFSQASVAEVMSALVNVHVDAEKGEGPALAKRFGVSGFPTLVVVDASGDEIDRIVGYMPPEPFAKEIRRILSGEGTVAALRKRWAESPGDVETGLALGARLAKSNVQAALDLFADLASKATDRETKGRVQLELAAALHESGRCDEAAKECERLLKEFGDTPAAGQVASRAGGSFLVGDPMRGLVFVESARGAAKDPKELAALEGLAVHLHRNGIAASLRRQAKAAGDDPQALNEVAWTCFEQKLNVVEAVGWASTAVEKSGRDPMILDTLANLLWIAGRPHEAIKTEEEAAGKAEPPMRKQFEATVAKWKSEMAAMKAMGAVPATPLVPPTPKPAEGEMR